MKNKLINATTPRDKNKTVQVVGTPPEFVEAVNHVYALVWDLACDNNNCVLGRDVDGYLLGFSEAACDSLKEDWAYLTKTLETGYLWLNPPFNNIRPWAQKCYEEMRRGARIVMLTPASIGTKWFLDYCYNKSITRPIVGRLTFGGHKAPFPKDLMLSVFDNQRTGFEPFYWR